MGGGRKFERQPSEPYLLVRHLRGANIGGRDVKGGGKTGKWEMGREGIIGDRKTRRGGRRFVKK